jgi:PAS domain S-box-containing protein
VRDVNDVITYWNRGAEELYGWKRNEAVGKNSHDLNHTVFPAPLEDITAELIRTGRWEGELIHTRRDGTKVVAASRWSLQRDDQGRPAATLETNNDITERKRAEEGLLQAQAELAHVTRVTTLGELAASIAHEINQPLAAIIADANACLHWLEADRPDLDSVREALVAIVKDGDRAAEVITRIRALLSRSSVAHEPCDLARVIREVHPLVRPELWRHGITLEMSLARDMPAVMGDRIQLQQVLLNLMMMRPRPCERSRRNGADWSCARPWKTVTMARGQSSRSRMPASASGRTRRPACSTRSTRRSRADWAWGCPSAARSWTITGDVSGRRRTRAMAPPFTSLCRGYDDVGCGRHLRRRPAIPK